MATFVVAPSLLRITRCLHRADPPDVHYTIYGLGDTSYERFCFAGKMLARRLDHLGANLLCEPAWGDERAPDG